MIAPQKPQSALWTAYLGHRARLNQSIQIAKLAEFEDEADAFAGIEKRAGADPSGQVAALHRELLEVLQQPGLHNDEAALARSRTLYSSASALTFPATTAFLAHSQGLAGLTFNLSLFEVDVELLRSIDLRSHEDPVFGTFVADMEAILEGAQSSPDATAYSQFFEIYAEAMVLDFLRGKGIPTRRIADSVSAPDFGCELPDGKEFFVEVKALDIVGGKFRHNEIMTDGLDMHVEIERQQRDGRRIASAHGEIAPLRKPYIDSDYDAYGTKRVIDTLRDKCRQAFKPSQFERGPTFALVVADRLIFHGWKSSIVPYYYEEGLGGQASVSGPLWHAAYGTVGAPVLRMPEFEGKPGLEGHLDKPGLYADDTQPFPGMGLVVLKKSSSGKRRLSYGLKAPREETLEWSSDDCNEALIAMTDAWNDADNTEGWKLTRYETS